MTKSELMWLPFVTKDLKKKGEFSLNRPLFKLRTGLRTPSPFEVIIIGTFGSIDVFTSVVLTVNDKDCRRYERPFTLVVKKMVELPTTRPLYLFVLRICQNKRFHPYRVFLHSSFVRNTPENFYRRKEHWISLCREEDFISRPPTTSCPYENSKAFKSCVVCDKGQKEFWKTNGWTRTSVGLFLGSTI